jgi:FHS family glucose/mannose:H+ symporter-like MFS transporter
MASSFAVLNNMLAPFWLKRWGVRRSLQVFSLVQVLGLVVMAMASQYIYLLIGAAFLGMSFGGLGIAQNILAGWGAPLHRKRQVYSGLHGMYGLSSLLAPMLISLLYAEGIGWQRSFLILAVMPLGVFIYSLISDHRQRGKPRPLPGLIPSLRPSRAVLWVAILISFYVIAEVCVSTRLVLLCRRDWRMSIDESNGLLSLFFLLMTVGRVTFAFYRMRLSNRTLMQISAGLSVLFTILGLFYHPLWLGLSGLTMSVFFPSGMAFISQDFPSGEAESATAWTLTLNSLGLMFMHLLVGSVSDHLGLTIAMSASPIFLVLTIFLLWRGRAPGETDFRE